jgi:transcriptional regulator with XRE-family HTH domain
MKPTEFETDDRVLAELGARIARQRLDAGLTQAGLAERAGVSKRTVERIEAGASTQSVNLVRVLRALDLLDALDSAIPEPGPSPLELLRQKGKPRVRASGRRRKRVSGEPWTWGDDA